MPRRFTEKELLKGLGPYTAHADLFAEPSSKEFTALDRLRGSVLQYEDTTKGLEDREHWSGSAFEPKL